MGFRLRLAVLFVATLAIVQALTAVLVYEVTRRQLIAEGERQLTAASDIFVRQLDDISEQVASSVQVLALDFALRSAIAQHDQETVLSALRNHARRVGASRMMLISLDRTIEADISKAPRTGHDFPYPNLLDKALLQPSAAIVALDGKAFWMVTVPVLAPVPIGFIAAAIPIDDELLARLQKAAALPRNIELVSSNGSGSWSVVAHGLEPVSLAGHLLPAPGGALPQRPALVEVDGRDFVALAVPINNGDEDAPIAAILGYSLDEALRPYRSVAIAWAALLAFGLGIGLVGALLIARGVSRPIEALAANARKIEAGDYSLPQRLSRQDEIGQLSAALASMAQAISEREERIRFQANHDIVTGLPNRIAMEVALDAAFDSAAGGAMLVVGLARLPEIVKTMGHTIADRLMQHSSAQVLAAAGDGSVARIGDSVLAVWLPHTGKSAAITRAFRILDGLREPYQEVELAIDSLPAVGIALSPDHGSDASVLMQHAEVALFGALGSDDPVKIYDPATDPHRPERLSLMGDLLQAIDHDRLVLHYQPKLNLATGEVDSVEGLVRWNHETRGLIPPADFIGLAEETGNIRKLTRWVIATGAMQAREWASRNWQIRVAVNISARDLGDSDLPRRVDELLAAQGVPPSNVMLEITESAVMGEPEAAIEVLLRLAARGIDLAIDDLGVGQTSLAYLRRLPVREIKIDQTFIRKLADNQEDQVIVRSIVELGHRLGYRVTAEGVEDSRALEYLAAVGCDYAQGYFIAKPMAPDDFDSFAALRSWPVRGWKEAV
jgi:EAL domain-containing protein (putative c-di-GMP-specific phosphodiesterase class I)/GGDEF domain-containing protein